MPSIYQQGSLQALLVIRGPGISLLNTQTKSASAEPISQSVQMADAAAD